MNLDILLSSSGNDESIFKLCDVIRETSFAIHKYHK